MKNSRYGKRKGKVITGLFFSLLYLLLYCFRKHTENGDKIKQNDSKKTLCINTFQKKRRWLKKWRVQLRLWRPLVRIQSGTRRKTVEIKGFQRFWFFDCAAFSVSYSILPAISAKCSFAVITDSLYLVAESGTYPFIALYAALSRYEGCKTGCRRKWKRCRW